jgi:hypothetical protein
MADDTVTRGAAPLSSAIALKLIRYHTSYWMECESVDDAVSTAYWMIEDNTASPIEVVDLAGKVLLTEAELSTRVAEYETERPRSLTPYEPQAIPEADASAAAAFSKFMGRHAANAADWERLSGAVKDVWRKRAAGG